MPIFDELSSRQPACFTELQPCFDAAFVLSVPVVIKDAVNPDSAHFTHRAVGENSGVLDRDASLIIEAIRHPAAQCIRRKPAFIHGDVEWMFVVISARADAAQIFHERLALPKPGSHKAIATSHLIMSF